MRGIGKSRKVLAIVVALLGSGMLAATSVASNAGAAGRVPTGDAFYVPPQPLAKAKPGTIIRSTPIADAPADARAWKILYHSRAVDGKDIAVSGWLIAPTGKAPSGGRVVVSWAHGSAGMADICAPSKQADIASGHAVVTGPASFGAYTPTGMVHTLLQAGYVIVATDYEGLGTPGLHPLLVGESEGRSVLDAARAARGFKPAAASSNVLAFGHSQGGHAALFAGELAASYAPDLRVLGVAAGGPGTDVELTVSVGRSISALNSYIVSIVEGFHAAYPQIDPAALLTPDALAKAPAVDQKCNVADTFANMPDPALAQNPLDNPAIETIFHKNSAGNRQTGAPMLVVQGTADQFASQIVTDLFVKRACAAGDTVDYLLVAGATHGEELNATVDDVAAWFADRVSGAPAPSTCSAD